LLAGLTLHTCPFGENIDWCSKIASKQDHIEDKIFIYKQIRAYAPYRLETYQELIPLITDFREKRELLLKAAGEAYLQEQFDLGNKWRFEAASLFELPETSQE
jgi:hypothetical protein